MRLTRTLCTAGLLCGLGLGATTVSGGCGGPLTTVPQADEETKAQAKIHGEKMKEFTKKMREKKAQSPK